MLIRIPAYFFIFEYACIFMPQTPPFFEIILSFLFEKKIKNYFIIIFPLFQLQMNKSHTGGPAVFFPVKPYVQHDHPSTLALYIDLLTVTHT